MKRVLIISILISGLLTSYSFAHMQEGKTGNGMMGSPGYGEAKETGSPSYPMMGHGMKGYGGYGMMGPGMMGNMMGPCMMGYGGYGMGPGMMGQGMMGGMMGPGMMGYGGAWGYNAEQYQKFLNDTKDLRKELHNKKFEYFEALRQPNTKRETITGLEKEIQDIQRKIYEKTQK